MEPTVQSVRYAERVLEGLDDEGNAERVVFSIDRRNGGMWVVSRVVDAHVRSNGAPSPGDEIFSGYELDDALEHANDALEDDVRVLEEEGLDIHVTAFTRKEILPKLEKWFLRES
jgi:hypothetical protein